MNAKRSNKMKLKDTACDVEYSKKLKELGLRISSLLFYNVITDEVVLNDDCNNYINVRNYAYTVAELGEMLPRETKEYMNYTLKDIDDSFYSKTCDHKVFEDNKEANSKAKLLIWLIENKHVNVEELNNE
jgi:hypothetical protein